MTDLELLERAAKAAGYTLREHYTGFPPIAVEINAAWNPLTDDGDALRLAVKLRMTVAHEPSRGGWSVGAVVNGEFRWLSHDDDCLRAIVRAAAEIGRAMK